ncbi:L,D-transpeptidase [Microbacterium paludicola]|uniref:L,D-transpeptidase n=1 Tax=Microbacterium paludicola TaxID=300019 RepID=UPI0031D7968E
MGSGVRRIALWGVVVLVVGGAVAVAVGSQAGQGAPSTARSVESPSAQPSPTPTPTPTPTLRGEPADTAAYDLGALPVADVFAINPRLPLDDDPDAPTTGLVAQPREVAAPVFDREGGEPVAQLPREQPYGGSVVPVIEEHDHWVRVLLTGRQALPGDGDPAQVTGWLRTADVDLTRNPHRVEVDLSETTVRIVTDDGSGEQETIVADDFAWGTEATPTPLGRSFVMFVDVVEEFAYTEGNPLVYLSVQSPTLRGFGGQPVAVTAFHYHAYRSGAISNGCLRVSAEATAVLSELPLGTPVHIRA